MPDVTTGPLWALLIAAVPAIIAWRGGIAWDRRKRESDLFREVGRIEGRNDPGQRTGPRSDDDPSRTSSFMLGQLMSSMREVQGDVTEIRTRQETNRAVTEQAHHDLAKRLDGFASRLSTMEHKVDAIARQVRATRRRTEP